VTPLVWVLIIVNAVFAAVIVGLVIWWLKRNKRGTVSPAVEVNPENVNEVVEFVRQQQQAAIEEQRLRDLKTAERKAQLETFKQTKEQLQENLKNQIGAKEWRPLESILKSADKGGVGIYILFNETKGKYYVGQAKQIYKRVRDHFAIEDIARDHLAGDKIEVKFLTANEIAADYRLDHIEKTAIEIFNADKAGYNKTTGNL